MKKLLSLLLCLVLALSLAACGDDPAPTTQPTNDPTTQPTTQPTEPPTEPPLTAADVYGKVLTAMEGIQATAMRMELSYSLNYAESEDAPRTEISYDMLMDVKVTLDPYSGYNLTSLTMGTEGFSMDITVEMYLLEEQGTIVTYAKTFGYWLREDSGMTAEEYLGSMDAMLVDMENIWTGGEMPADMTLDENTQDLNGAEVYVLRGTNVVSGIEEVLIEMGVELEDGEAQMAMPVVYYVDAQNFAILRMVCDMQPMMDVLSEAMAQSLAGTDAESIDLEISISDAVYDLGYGEQDVPELPQEALDYIEENESSLGGEEDYWTFENAYQLEDGSFAMTCGEDAVQITCPEGWEGMVCEENNIYLMETDGFNTADIFYLEDETEESILEDWVQSEAAWMELEGCYVGTEEGPEVEGYKTVAIVGTYTTSYIAYAPIGDGYLLVYMSDYDEVTNAAVLMPQIIANITPYVVE